MDSTASFGYWVRRQRKALDLTQAELAHEVSCAVATIKKIEVDERRPSRHMAERLAEVLGISDEERTVFIQCARRERSPLALPLPARPTVPSGTPGPLGLRSLPASMLPLVGREEEVATALALLRRDEVRLLTLIGPGGIGKTRLAVQIAQQYLAPADGAVFVALAPIERADLLCTAIADALGLAFYGPDTYAAQLLRYLQDKELLLVLDNLEHLLGSTQLVIDLINTILRDAAGVKVLVTSRERLHLQQEWVLSVEGLRVEPVDADDHHGEADAVRLFITCADRVQADFQPTAAEYTAVTRICTMLGGMPLGIELAATWVRVLSCAAIAAELEQGMDFLESSLQDVSARHRSLRAVFDHSWHLLAPAEQEVLRQLSVFRGGFGREAAMHVAGAKLTHLAALIDKSLLRRVAQERYDLHEAVRQYAEAHLIYVPLEEVAARGRHSAYYLALLRDSEGTLKSARQSEMVAELTVEIDNVRAAWRWAIEHHQLADIRSALPGLFYFFEIRSWYEEAVMLFQQAADMVEAGFEAATPVSTAEPGEEQMLLGELHIDKGWFLFRAGHFQQALEAVQRSELLLDFAGETAVEFEGLSYLWMLRHHQGDYSKGAELLRRRLHLQRTRKDSWGMAFSLLHLGLLAQYQGETDAAYQLLREALVQVRRTGDPVATVRVLGYAASAAHSTGHTAEAQSLAHEGLERASALHDRFSMAVANYVLGLVAHTHAAYQEAEHRFRTSLALFEEIGGRWFMAPVLNSLSYTLLATGAATEASRTFLEALKVATETETLSDVLEAVAGIAAVWREQGELERAMMLYAHLLQHPGTSPHFQTRVRAWCQEVERALPPAVHAQVAEHTRNSSFGELLAELAQTTSNLR